jgi:CRP/FNR family cyclic AMP-dependent transcriptional regulator
MLDLLFGYDSKFISWLNMLLPALHTCYIKTSPDYHPHIGSSGSYSRKYRHSEIADPQGEPMDELAAFVRTQPTKKFSKDCILTYQGELPTALYAIRSGYVKIYDISSDGNEQFLGLAGKYDFVPSEILFSHLRAAQFFYAAFTPVEVYRVNRDEFMDRVRHSPAALYKIVEAVTEKYHNQMHHLTAVQKPKAREKIIYVLHFLATHFTEGAATANHVPLPLTQQDIANLVGVTRETAAHELKQLKSEGYIAYNKTAFYIDDKLANLIS